MAIIGIDLGTSYSAAAHCVDGQPEIIMLDGEPMLASVVSLLKSGKIVVGRAAKRNQTNAPHSTISGVKRMMGQNTQVRLGDKSFTPQQISAMILKRIKEQAEEQLGEPVTGAVISCPTYFKNPQRAATMEAGELAGLRVLQIINEPTAAAYAYGVQQGAEGGTGLFLVYDLGGSAIDVTLIRMADGNLEVIGTGGDSDVGGATFDDKIVDWMLECLERDHPGYLAATTDENRLVLNLRLKSIAEEGKKELCRSESGEHQFQIPQVDTFQGRPLPFTETLTMAKFETLIQELLVNSLKRIEEAFRIPQEKHSCREEDLTAVLLVGGSTRVPAVRHLLEKRFARTKTPVWGHERGINLDEIVALGASLVASAADPDSDEVPRKALVDVTGHTLSVAVMDDAQQRQVLSRIIPKESRIPCMGDHLFQIPAGGQRQCRIEIYQGEGLELKGEGVIKIGEFLIEIAPSQSATTLRIGLALDINGILSGLAVDETSGREVRCQLIYQGKAKISDEELARKRAELDVQLNSVLGQSNPLDVPVQGPPTRAPGGAIPAKPSESSPRRSPIVDENVQFTVYRPKVVRPRKWYDLLAFAHLADKPVDAAEDDPDPVEEVKRQANQILGEMAATYKDLTHDSTQALPRQSDIIFVPEMDGIEFNPPRGGFKWQEPFHRVDFRMRASDEADGRTVRGRLTVFWGAIILADVPLVIRVDSKHLAGKTQDPPAVSNARPYGKIFASYSHKDLPVVEQFEEYGKTIGHEYLRDWKNLRAGEIWSDKLRHMIEEADIFQLFWSSNSMASPFVRQEWEHALSLGRPAFVRPCYWENPMPRSKEPVLPPPDLARLHFQSIGVTLAPAGKPGAESPHATVPRPPATPQSFRVNVVPGRAFLDWALVASDSPATYRLARSERRDVNDPAANVRRWNMGKRPSYEDTALVPGRSYWYFVDAVVNGMASLPASVGPVLAIAEVINLCVRPGDGQVKLTWTEPPGIKRIEIQRAIGIVPPPVACSDGAMLRPTGPGVLVDTGLTNQTPYGYRVRCVFQQADGRELVTRGEALLATPCGSPALLADVKGEFTTDGAFKLSWKNPSQEAVAVLAVGEPSKLAIGETIAADEVGWLGQALTSVTATEAVEPAPSMERLHYLVFTLNRLIAVLSAKVSVLELAEAKMTVTKGETNAWRPQLLFEWTWPEGCQSIEIIQVGRGLVASFDKRLGNSCILFPQPSSEYVFRVRCVSDNPAVYVPGPGRLLKARRRQDPKQ